MLLLISAALLLNPVFFNIFAHAQTPTGTFTISGSGTTEFFCVNEANARQASFEFRASGPMDLDGQVPHDSHYTLSVEGKPPLTGSFDSWDLQNQDDLIYLIDNGPANALCDGAITLSVGAICDSVTEVVLLDGTGNSAGSGNFNIDPTCETILTPNPIDTTITSAVDGNGNPVRHQGSTTSTSIQVSFESLDSDIERFECSLDSASYTTCTSPSSYQNLALESHTFSVRSVDTSGRVDESPAQFIWNVIQISDTDQDGVADENDNCSTLANPDQADTDRDGVGNVCDNDRDGDGASNANDNCPDTSNPDQANADGDTFGDVCDETPFPPDADRDGLTDSEDNCVNTPNPGQEDTDRDGQGNACDPDDDNDTIPDEQDKCAGKDDRVDRDHDGIPDGCDTATLQSALVKKAKQILHQMISNLQRTGADAAAAIASQLPPALTVFLDNNPDNDAAGCATFNNAVEQLKQERQKPTTNTLTKVTISLIIKVVQSISTSLGCPR